MMKESGGTGFGTWLRGGLVSPLAMLIGLLFICRSHSAPAIKAEPSLGSRVASHSILSF
jgi:hypothetical protein